MKKSHPGVKPYRRNKSMQKALSIGLKLKRIQARKKIDSLPGIVIDKDVDTNQILAKAFDEMDGVILAGYDKDGEFYFASSIADGGEILWLIEKLKFKLMDQVK